MPHRLVLVEWHDSRQPTSAWQKLADYEPQPACLCASVGWLIHDGDDVKALAPNVADLDDDMQASGVIHIPAACVRKMVPLVEDKAD